VWGNLVKYPKDLNRRSWSHNMAGETGLIGID
jgi:hypothetical protein